MALPREVLTQVAALDEPRAAVQRAVEQALNAQQPGGDPLTKTEALSILEEATATWLSESDQVETTLLGYARRDEPEPGDDVSTAADAVERLFGISLLHLAVTADLAKLGPIDFLADNDPVSAADSPPASARSSAIEAVAGDAPQHGQVGRALTMSSQESDKNDDTGADAPALQVLTELVDRAGECACAVLVGTVPSAHVIFDNVKPLLESAIGLAPDAISSVADNLVRSIARLVTWVLRRVRVILDAVAPNAFDVVGQFLESAKDEGKEQIVGLVVRPVVAAILKEQHGRTVISQNRLNRAARHTREPDNKAALQKILKHNKRWVARPVPVVAKTALRPLWHVVVAGVPAAPIAACVLLAWTILLTGDELDNGGPFPNFYRPGLLTIA